jgi:hypothetical protein
MINAGSRVDPQHPYAVETRMRARNIGDPYVDRPPVKHAYEEEPKDIWEAILTWNKIAISIGKYQKIWLCFSGNGWVYLKDSWGQMRRSSIFSNKAMAEHFYNSVTPERLWVYKKDS